MNEPMRDVDIQVWCEHGQRQLMATEYLRAVETLAAAEQAAWDIGAFDTLARLYLPLQEARRQVRQRCGDGLVSLRGFCAGPSQTLEPAEIVAEVPQGQLLVAGWGSTTPAAEVRRLAADRSRYLETFLGAAFPLVDGPVAVLLAPLDDSPLPGAEPRSIEQLRELSPAGSLVIPMEELPDDYARGNSESYAIVMALWERLHRPFLQAAERETDPLKRMQAFRLTLRVDPACELAHQHLADTARALRARPKLKRGSLRVLLGVCIVQSRFNRGAAR